MKINVTYSKKIANKLKRMGLSDHAFEQGVAFLAKEDWLLYKPICQSCGKTSVSTWYDYCPDCGYKQSGEKLQIVELENETANTLLKFIDLVEV